MKEHEESTAGAQVPGRWRRRAAGTSAALAFTACAMVLLGIPVPVASSLSGAPPVLPDSLGPLGDAAVPVPTGLGTYVTDVAAAKQLGKALFWDMQAGSDGVTACATCHFAAGTDNRTRNTLSPGGPDSGVTAFTATFRPNHDLTADDFPFVKHADPGVPNSPITGNTAAVVGSQGVFPSAFNAIIPGMAKEDTAPAAEPDPTFSENGTNVRRVTGRRAPSVINAVFNHRNFWDGRARNHFNGVNPFGELDPTARVGRATAGGVSLVAIPPGDLNNASLASQATGPPGNDVEMSASGRTLRDIGKKLLNLEPLAGQAVDPTDSVLGVLADSTDGKGLSRSYRSLVEQAFVPTWWQAPDTKLGVDGTPVAAPGTAPDAALPGGEYSLMQYNWPLFWGLAIGLYESTLVSDGTPFDRYAAGDGAALTPTEIAGLGLFTGQANCSTCHGGPELTDASVGSIGRSDTVDDDGRGNTFDTGFMNIGVKPTGEDLGAGADRGLGPWSDAKRSALCSPPNRCVVDGAFKTPGIRNVALRAPYFHNGGQLTLEQVVDFYNRGGDFANPDKHREVEGLGLTDGEKASLVAFLRALTDPRVENRSAPFDHPQLFVPDGHVAPLGPDARDRMVEIPATGAAGGAPLRRFLAASPPSGPPTVVQPPPAVASPLALTGLWVDARVRRSRLAARGLTVTMISPAESRVVRMQLLRRVEKRPGSGRFVQRMVLARIDRRIDGGKRVRLTIPARLVRRLPPGRYLLRATPGERLTSLGLTSSRAFSVVRDPVRR